MDNVIPTGAEFYMYLRTVEENEQMQSFPDFFKKYNNKDVVQTLEAM